MDLKPEHFEDLIPLVALYRPGPLGSGMVADFIDRRHGKKEVTYLHPIFGTDSERYVRVLFYTKNRLCKLRLPWVGSPLAKRI